MATLASAGPPTAWHGAGARLPCIDGHVFVRTEGDLRSAVPLLLLHGFPTSSYDFAPVWARLARRRPLIALDFIGFGMSDKPTSFGYTLGEQADVVLEVLAKLGVGAVHLLAHDMGTSVATELCARRLRGLLQVGLESVILSNGSVFLDMARLQPAQRLLRQPLLGSAFARLSSYPVFRASLRRLYAEPDAIGEEELRVAWALLTRDGGLARLPSIIAYLDERERLLSRWVGALERLDLPALVLWGARDPVALLAIGERLGRVIPGARLRVLHDLGHFPQVEAPDVFAAEVLDFLGELPA
jgi:pimeloyl-ACP methyl ester carboxylesterase